MTKISLKAPVEHDGKTYDSIEIKEPTVAAVAAYVKAAPESELAATIAMVAVSGEIPEEALRKVLFSDFKKVMEATGPLLEKMIAGDGGATSA